MIRVGLIGLNFHSHSVQIYNSVRKQSDLFEVVGYCLPEGEKEKYPKKLKCLEGLREIPLEEMLSDDSIDAFIVETDEIYLTKYALKVAAAGKHIHMEKPGGQNLKDFETLVQTMKQNQKVFHIGYMYRYNPTVRKLLQRVKQGELGEIISVEAQMNCLQNAEVRAWLNDLPGGQMFFLGCHLVDLILQIKGTPNKVLSMCPDREYGFAAFEYSDGVSFAKTHAGEYGGYARRQLVVTGTKETVEIKPLEMGSEAEMHSVQTVYNNSKWGDGGTRTQSECYDRYDSMMAHFAHYVTGEKTNPYTYDYELELYKMVLTAAGII